MSNSFEKQIGDQLFTIETGKLAQQATAQSSSDRAIRWCW